MTFLSWALIIQFPFRNPSDPGTHGWAIFWGNWFPFPASTPHSIAYFPHVKLNMLLSILISLPLRNPAGRHLCFFHGRHGSFMDFASYSISWLFSSLLPVIPWILLLWIACYSEHPDRVPNPSSFHCKWLWGELWGEEVWSLCRSITDVCHGHDEEKWFVKLKVKMVAELSATCVQVCHGVGEPPGHRLPTCSDVDGR